MHAEEKQQKNCRKQIEIHLNKEETNYKPTRYMKKILLPAIAALAIFTACGNKTQAENKSTANDRTQTANVNENANAENNEEETAQVTVEQLKFKKESKTFSVNFDIAFPKTDNAVLQNALAEFISEQLGGTYTGSLNEPQKMVEYYGNQAVSNLKKELKESGGDGSTGEYCNDFDIKKLNEGKHYVTYHVQEYISTGGAHGSTVNNDVTFRKSDGRRFGYDMMRNTSSEAFHKLLKEGVKDYFKEMNGVKTMSDEELQEQIITNDMVDYLPLPVTQPYFDEKGVSFTYQQYEIVCYAAGMPCFTIPYSKMRPYLTQTALKMIENK